MSNRHGGRLAVFLKFASVKHVIKLKLCLVNSDLQLNVTVYVHVLLKLLTDML